MFEISITGTDKLNAYEELIKVFLQPSEYRMARPSDETAPGPDRSDPQSPEEPGENFGLTDGYLADGGDENRRGPSETVRLEYRYDGDADEVKRQIYRDLRKATGKSPKWGILTGIRPVKLAYELAYGARRDLVPENIELPGNSELPETAGSTGSAELPGRDPAVGHRQFEEAALRADAYLRQNYLLHPDKADLAAEILEYQRRSCGDPPDRSLAVYVGIPFCPTRCLYCSFTSNQVGEEEIARYLEALHREIDFAAAAAKEDGFRVESVYIGGGTPTTPETAQLEALLERIRSRFDLSGCREFTVEAGRPDTFTPQKLDVLRRYGVDRISINPQTMRQQTLDLIGRRHTVEQTEEAFRMAKAAGFTCINTDLIAGLPGEDAPAFAESLERILDLGADNITLHTLAVKRASRLKEMDENFNYRQEDLREEMLAHAARRLRQAGFRPYYLYRQKHTSGNTENIGYCRDDKFSVYNIRIMEERQSILALGAGGISKIWFPAENRLERVANVSNYEIYIDRIDEMMDRKRQKFFGQTR